MTCGKTLSGYKAELSFGIYLVADGQEPEVRTFDNHWKAGYISGAMTACRKCPRFELVPRSTGNRLIPLQRGRCPFCGLRCDPNGSFAWAFLLNLQPGSIATLLWVEATLHHLRSPRLMISLSIPTNKWFPMASKWCRISCIHSRLLVWVRGIALGKGRSPPGSSWAPPVLVAQITEVARSDKFIA